MDRRVHPLGVLGVVCVPGALEHGHLAAGGAPPVRAVHADERGVVRRLLFTGWGGRGRGPGAGGAGRGEAMSPAGVQACYSHDLRGSERRILRLQMAKSHPLLVTKTVTLHITQGNPDTSVSFLSVLLLHNHENGPERLHGDRR